MTKAQKGKAKNFVIENLVDILVILTKGEIDDNDANEILYELDFFGLGSILETLDFDKETIKKATIARDQFIKVIKDME